MTDAGSCHCEISNPLDRRVFVRSSVHGENGECPGTANVELVHVVEIENKRGDIVHVSFTSKTDGCLVYESNETTWAPIEMPVAALDLGKFLRRTKPPQVKRRRQQLTVADLERWSRQGQADIHQKTNLRIPSDLVDGPLDEITLSIDFA